MLEESILEYSVEDQLRILDAGSWAELHHRGQWRANGKPFIVHPLTVARTIASMKLDAETVIAALLHDVLEDTELSRSELRSRYGREVENLVNGVTKIAFPIGKNKTIQKAETIRKMFFAMVRDIRVIMIKLADKLHNMQTLHFLTENKQKETAQECLDIFAPLAERLGMHWLQADLEDLALKVLNPKEYLNIKRFVAEKKEKRAAYLLKIEKEIREAAEAEDIEVEVETRAKHFYSIYRKMTEKHKDLKEIYDTLGLRVHCHTKQDCYTILGLVHGLWRPIEGRIKDYIGLPKSNGYQSIHTTVMCEGGRPTEIQIRTFEMHRTSEYGIAAHWIYKQGLRAGKMKPSELAIVSKLRDWKKIKISSNAFLEEIKKEILKDSIFVYTPQGDVVELPQGATPLDFAYYIHTEVGNHCIGAKVDNRMVTLSQELNNTQRIEILTRSDARPRRDWLTYVKTARARESIRNWLNHHDEEIIIARDIVAQKPKQDLIAPRQNQKEQPLKEGFFRRKKPGIVIGKERNLMIHLAGCCNPSIGDQIIGYISRGRGIIVHRADCKNLNSIPEFKERQIKVEWETEPQKKIYRLFIRARMTSDLFSEVDAAVRRLGGSLLEGKVEKIDRQLLFGDFSMELDSNINLSLILHRLRKIPNILQIQKKERVPTYHED